MLFVSGSNYFGQAGRPERHLDTSLFEEVSLDVKGAIEQFECGATACLARTSEYVAI